MNMNEIEIASRRAWPALEEHETPAGVLRYAAGVSRRSNSMNPLCDRSVDAVSVIQSSEDFFAPRKLPSVVRVTAPLGHMSASQYLLDGMLQERGYRMESPTMVMVAPVQAGSERVEAPAYSQQQWLEAWYRVKAMPTESLSVHAAMLARIEDPHYLALRFNALSAPLATALAVHSQNCLGLFGVATAEQARRQGQAQSLLRELLAWGAGRGARYAYLQVETANMAARQLYEKHGFQEAYSYWYRVKNLSLTNPHDDQ